MTSTGNQNGRVAVQTPALTTLTDLVYPGVRWDEQEYARLQARLDVYEDFIVLSRYRHGEVTQQYVVDPTELAIALAGISLTSGPLPPQTLFWGRKEGYDYLGVYLPPAVWPVAVRYDTQTKLEAGRAWQVPLPGLLFVGHHHDYQLWAVADDPPFGPETPLYVAPLPNVHPNGVCRGSAPFPPASPATIYQAVTVFFESRFNHDLSRGKSKRHPERVLDHWYELDQAGRSRYPLDDLLPAEGKTLKAVANG